MILYLPKIFCLEKLFHFKITGRPHLAVNCIQINQKQNLNTATNETHYKIILKKANDNFFLSSKMLLVNWKVFVSKARNTASVSIL